MSNQAADEPAEVQGRADERVKLHRRAQLVIIADIEQSPLEVTLGDISFGGAGLISEIDIQPGTAATLLIQSTAPRSIRGHIVSSSPTDHDQFRLSMRFDVTSGPALERVRFAFFAEDALGE